MEQQKEKEVSAEVAVYTLGGGTTGAAVFRFVEVLNASGLKPHVGPMSTLIRGPASRVFAALQEATGLNTPDVSVAALKDSTSQIFVETLMPRAKLVPTDSYETAIDLLFKGKVDVVVADFPFCALTAYRHRDKGLFAGNSPLSFEPLGIAMHEDTLLINWVQNLMNMLEGTGQLKRLQKRWLDGGEWIERLP